MELSHLHRNTIKKSTKQPFSTITNDRLNTNTSALDFCDACQIQRIRLGFYLLFVQKLSAQAIPKHHNTEITTKISRVHQHIGYAVKFFLRSNFYAIQFALNRFC
jgi:cytochrome oxidase assembly protein ShyY1